ncbi:MAG: PP2C family protein-serine/threonine phosphatase [Tepidisphaeraceae bacterium]
MAVLIGLLAAGFDASRRFQIVAKGSLRIQELRGRIVYLDEVLTMSARMAAQTGDPAWQKRYDTNASQLDAAIAEAKSLVPKSTAATQSDVANQALLALESQCFALVREGSLAKAQSVLNSDEYESQKALYSRGMAQLGSELNAAAESAIKRQRTEAIIQLIVGLAAIVLVIVAWVFVVRVMRRWLVARTQLSMLERDLDLARDIQAGLMPTAAPDIDGYDIAGMARPAQQTGGDYYDWQQMPDGRLVVALADVTGHGIGPALVMAICRAYARSATSAIADPATLLARVNNLIFPDLASARRFITMAIAVLSPDGGIALVSAGHGPTLHYQSALGTVRWFGGTGLPLGIDPEAEYGPQDAFQLERGDVFVLLTDGFMEWARERDAEQFGTDRLCESLAKVADQAAAEIITSLDAAVQAFAEGALQLDDATAVVIKRM